MMQVDTKDSLPDPIERGESRAALWEEKMERGVGIMECFCGELFHENDGEVLTEDPWGAPVCPNCQTKYFEQFKQ